MKEIDLLFRSCCDYPRDDSLDQLDRIHSLPHSPAHCGVLCPIKLDRIHSLPHSPAHCCVLCSIILPHYSSHPIPKLTVQHIHHALLAPPKKKNSSPRPLVCPGTQTPTAPKFISITILTQVLQSLRHCLPRDPGSLQDILLCHGDHRSALTNGAARHSRHCTR